MSVAAMKARFRNVPSVTVSVHRGAWGPLPENSLAAIRAAADWDVIEVDVALDANGDAYLMHDDTLARMTGHPGLSEGADPRVLPTLFLREGAGGAAAALSRQHVPRLTEAFAALEGSDAIFDLDVKHPENVPAVAAQVARLGGQDRATVKIDVGSLADIQALKELETRHGVMVMAKVTLRNAGDLRLVRALRDSDQAVVEMWFDDLGLVARACAIAGNVTRIGTYTLDPVHCCGLSDARALKDPDAVWGRLIDAGIRQIMTDQREALTAFLGR